MPTRASQQPTLGSTSEDDFYRLLGVGFTATEKEITRAYRAAMKRGHPDRVRPERRKQAEELAKQLNLAYRTLTTPSLKLEYDQKIKASAVQDQIMGRYVGGFATGGAGGDPYAESVR